VRWSGLHLQKRLPFSLPGKIRPKSMARGSALEKRDERLVVLLQMPSPVPRQWDATLPSRSSPLVERSASRERFYESEPFPWPTRLIVCNVLCGSSISTQQPKAIVLVGSVLSVVSCLHLPLWSENPSLLDRCGGWMWQVERFAAPGRPTGVGNTLRSFPWFRPSNRFCLLAHRVLCVRIRAFVGMTDSRATPGGDLRNYVSLSLAFRLFLLSTRPRRNQLTKKLFS
jgi:hypothetical protein